MSSKANKIAKQVTQEEVKTKSITYRLDLKINGSMIKTTYIVVSGIPEDLPAEYMDTVKRSAESQFASVINQRTFLEFYNEGKSSKDEQPIFYNLKEITSIQAESIKEIQ